MTPAAFPNNPIRTGYRRSDAGFAILLALVSSSLMYRFGSGNQLEQLPIILRQLDPAYLANDFFVSSTVDFGPRFYFARIVAALSQVLTLPGTYAVLRFVSDLALVAVTMWASARIVGADRLGGMIAAVLTVSVSSFHLGDATELRYAVFQPASLAIPFALVAVGFGVLGRPAAAALSALVAAAPHPLYGVYGGALGLAAAFFALASAVGNGGLRLRGAAIRAGGAGVLFGAGFAVLWWWPMQAVRPPAPLSTGELFDILARFRSPHHYLPSHFRPQDFVTTAAFAWVVALAYRGWRPTVPCTVVRGLLAPLLLVAGGCAAGAVFTEIWPSRTVLTLQPFRLLGVFKWIGFLLLGRLLSEYWRQPPSAIARPVAGLSLLAAGGVHPLVTAAGISIVRWRGWIAAIAPVWGWLLLLAVGTLVLSFAFDSVGERVRLLGALGLLGSFYRGGRAAAVVAMIASLAVGAVAMNRPGGSVFKDTPFHPVATLDDRRDAEAAIARAAAAHSPPDAVFVVPPHLGVLRLIGQRALVVDFEAIPLQDAAMREWRERIRGVYGDVDAAGHDARQALERRYREVTDAHLRRLADRYGATHAVLFVETSTAAPVLYEDAVHRVVSLRGR